MPRRKYNAAQEAGLEFLASIHVKHTLARAHMRAEIERQYEVKLADFEMQKSKEMNRLLAMGVSKSDLGRSIGSQNWDTMKRLLALSVDTPVAPAASLDPVVIVSYLGYTHVQSGHFTTGAMTYTYNGEELQKMIRYDLRNGSMEWVEYQPSDEEKAYVEAFVRLLEPRAGHGNNVLVNEVHLG